tara:strand:+ start:32 stop:268 length:237 start_codon:yes stop_codon:yes gene_type:complete
MMVIFHRSTLNCFQYHLLLNHFSSERLIPSPLGTVHNIPLSTSLATSPILEVVVTSEPMSAEDAKRAKRTGAVQNGIF